MLEEGTSGKKSGFSAEELDDEELSRMEDCRPVRLCVHAREFDFLDILSSCFVAFCQKKSKVKSLIPPPRTQKASSKHSGPVFSPQTPQHTFMVCLHDRFYQGEMLRL